VTSYAFTVDGRPTTQGSKVRTRWGIRESGGDNLVLWREAVRATAVQVRGDNAPLTGPLGITLAFRLPAPKSRPKRRRTWPIGKNAGDLDKLARAVLDGLTTSHLIDDDGLFVEALVAKEYPIGDEVPGVSVRIWTVTA
jgi:Holliday junction resolvase RusA-like endonuclease